MPPLIPPPLQCLRCIRRRPLTQLSTPSPPCRVLSTTSTTTHPAPSSCSSVKKLYTPLPHRRLLSLSGPDASTFLQGLTTTNIHPTLQIQGGAGFYSAFLNAAGRVLYDVFIYPTAGFDLPQKHESGGEEGGFLIEVDAREAQALAGHLRKFRLRRKVEIGVLDGSGGDYVDDGERWRRRRREGWGVYAIWGGEEQQHRGGADEHGWSAARQIGCVDARAPGFGHRLVLPNPPQPSDLDAEEVSLEKYQLRRILRGLPEGQTEIPKETALPLESNLDLMGGIDFRKGCYVGQELTIRTHHTGVVRKRILPVVVYRPGEQAPEGLDGVGEGERGVGGILLPPAGANVSRVGGGRGRIAGRWVGGVGGVGLALCRLEVMTDSMVGGSNQWKAGEEFKVTWEEGEVMVKAFVPGWFRERAEGLRAPHGV